MSSDFSIYNFYVLVFESMLWDISAHWFSQYFCSSWTACLQWTETLFYQFDYFGSNNYETIIIFSKCTASIIFIWYHLLTRPGLSQGMLYKQCCQTVIQWSINSSTKWVTLFLPWLYGSNKPKWFEICIQS